jgi:ferredoxin
MTEHLNRAGIPHAASGCESALKPLAPGAAVPDHHVRYRSRGSVLIAGDTIDAADVARALAVRAPRLRIALFAPGVDAVPGLPFNISAVGGRIVSLRGHLGCFAAGVRVGPDKVDDAGIFSGNADRHFDLVLDLSREPLLGQSVPAHGYYAPRGDGAALEHAMESLPAQVGDFCKPVYFDYRAELCTHGALGVSGCTRCLDGCDAAAIRSEGDKIAIDPHLCQGCASCALACPTGALRFTQPNAKAPEDALRELAAAQPGRQTLVVHDVAARAQLSGVDDSTVALFEVSPLAACPDTLWLTAILLGFRAIVLVTDEKIPPRGRRLIEQKVGDMRAMFGGFGGDLEVLTVTADSAKAAVGRLSSRTRATRQPTSVVRDWPEPKRAGFLARVDALDRDAQVAASVALPSGAAFGRAVVDRDKCTLCHACVNLCPTGALSGDAVALPALFFTESACVQCGLCSAGCPEHAITLEPRFVLDAIAREVRQQVASDQLVACSQCGALFTGRRKLEASLALMQKHLHTLPASGLESLRMCPDCRRSASMTM